MIQCIQKARGHCGGELCNMGRRCDRYEPARAKKAYGWDVTVRFGFPLLCDRTFHWRGCSATAARRKGMLKPHAIKIVSINLVPEAEWIRAYGNPELKNES